MLICRGHIKSGSVQTVFKPVCFQSISGGGFNPVRSGFTPAVKWYTRYFYFDKSMNAHMCTRSFNKVKMVGWTNDQTMALVSVRVHANIKGQLDGVTRNRTIFERISIFAGMACTVMVMLIGHVTKTTLHLWVCNSVNTRKRIEPVWMRIDAKRFECTFHPVCSVNGPWHFATKAHHTSKAKYNSYTLPGGKSTLFRKYARKNEATKAVRTSTC